MRSSEGHFIDPDRLPWEPVRPDLTRGVSGRVLLRGVVRAVQTRVDPGGSFALHSDQYDHLFYLLAGSARVRVGDEERELGAGAAVRVPAGTPHAYANAGDTPLVLLSLNFPADSA